jgi:hypothetical protein
MPVTFHNRVAAILLIALTVSAAAACGARADGPGVGSPWVVSLGDSYISGEGGRWAGNTSTGQDNDALGPTAYFDNATRTAETIPGCHRSASAEVHIGGAVRSKNLACSGAITTTVAGPPFKPGIDFYDGAAGKGQAQALQEFARSNNVRMVMLSIGGNDFNFSSIVQSCVIAFIAEDDPCNSDPDVTTLLSPANVATVTTQIKDAIQRIRIAMSLAGYGSSQYTVLVQNYPSPLATTANMRYAESPNDDRIAQGCPFYDADADYADGTILPIVNGAVADAVATVVAGGARNVRVLDQAALMDGRRLCERSVGTLEERGLSSWRGAGAVDSTEWLVQIGGGYQPQELFHPNYWAQLALRNCVRQAYNGGTPQGGACSRDGNGLTGAGEPVMTLRGADLSVALTAASRTLLTDQIDYTLTVGDNGPANARSGTVVIQLPAQARSISNGGACTYDAATDRVTCPTGAIANGASRTIRFSAQYALSLGLGLSSTARRTISAPDDPNPANDSASASCTVVAPVAILC